MAKRSAMPAEPPKRAYIPERVSDPAPASAEKPVEAVSAPVAPKPAQLNIRLSEADRDLVKKFAIDEKMSVNDFVKWAIFQAIYELQPNALNIEIPSDLEPNTLRQKTDD